MSQFGMSAIVTAVAVFALGLGIVICIVGVVLGRVGRLERRLEGVARTEDLTPIVEAAGSDARFRPLDEGMRRLGDAIARLPAPLEAKDLVPVQERLEMLSRTIDELRHHVDELRSREPGPVVAEVGPGAQVLRALSQRGFESIRIVGEVGESENGEPARVPVEARRAGMSYKGFVTLEDGRIADLTLKPVTEVFP